MQNNLLVIQLNVFLQLILLVNIKLISKIIVGFTILTPVIHFHRVLSSLSNYFEFLVDDQTALTRDFARGGQNSRTTPYYIWIPYILIVAALLTYLPAWLWHVVGHRATFDIPAMINQLSKTNLTDTEERTNMLTILTKHYEKAQRFNRTDRFIKRFVSILMFFAGGGVLTGIYFFIKILYLINSIGQFFLINYYLKIDYWSYGQTILFGQEKSELFPRIVFCDFTIRYLADNIQNYTVKSKANE